MSIANHRNRTTKKTSAPSKSINTHWRWKGWQDKKAGLPYCKEYDLLEQHLQRCYELGRLTATAAKTEWGVIFNWNRNETIHNAMTKHTDNDPETWQAMSDENKFILR